MKGRLSRSQVRLAKEFVAELLGTAVLLMFGCGCVAQSVLSHKENGGMLSINLGWGLGVLLGIMLAGPVSGIKNWFPIRQFDSNKSARMILDIRYCFITLNQYPEAQNVLLSPNPTEKHWQYLED